MSWMFHDFPLQFPEGFQSVGHSIGMDIIVQQQDTSDSLPLLLEQIAGFSHL
jgi:hypothetical protein